MVFVTLLLVLSFGFMGRSLITKRECTIAHNRLRELHENTPPLEWDESIAEKAQLYAEKLVEINRGSARIQLVHEKGTQLGENLYSSDNRKIASCADASLAWYKEINDYNYRTASSINGYPIGHFTQLVWRSTQKFGVGIATMESPTYGHYGNVVTFIVAKYSPRGNFYYTGRRVQDYTYNVQPRKPGSKTPSISQLERAE